MGNSSFNLLNNELATLRAEFEEQKLELAAARRQLEALKQKHTETLCAAEQWKTVFDAVGDPVFLHDGEFKIVRANKAYADIAGMDIKAVIGKCYWEVFPKRNGPLPHCKQNYEDGEGNLTDEFRLDCGRVFSSRSYSLKDEQGEYQYAVHILQDITEVRVAESERRARLHFFESMDRINRAIQCSDNIESMMKRVLSIVLDVFDCDRAFLLHPCDPEAKTWFCPMECTKPEYPGVLSFNTEIPVTEDVATTFEVILEAQGRPVSFDPTSDYAVPEVASKQFQVQSFLAMAIYPRQGEAWEFGIHQCAYPRVWTKDEIKLCQEIGRRLGDALTTLLMFNRLQSTLNIVENSTSMIFSWSAADGWPVKDVSANVEGILGYTADDFREKRVLYADLIHPDDVDRLRDEVKTYRDSGKTHFTAEYRLVCKNGESRWVTERTLIRHEPDGDLVVSEGVVTDINERKLATEALRKSRDLLNTIVEHIPASIFWKDKNLRYLGCNTQFAKDGDMSGPDEIVGKDDAEMVWREQAAKYQADDRKVMEAASPKLDYEEQQTRSDGQIKWVRTSKVPLSDPDGNIIGLLGIYQDITRLREDAERLKHSEKNLRWAQKVAHLGSWSLSVATRRLTWSDETSRIFEVGEKVHNTSYKAFLEMVHPDDRQRIDDAYTQHLSDLKPLDIEHRLLFAQGRIKYVRQRCETTSDQGGNPRMTLGTIQDITEQKLADIRLRRLNRTLRMLADANERFVLGADEQALLGETCRMLVQSGYYPIACIGYFMDASGQSVKTQACQTDSSCACHSSIEQLVDTAELQMLIDNIEIKHIITQAKPLGEAVGGSVLLLPLVDSANHIFGVMTIGLHLTEVIDDEELILLKELAKDLSYGINNLRAGLEREHTARQLHDSLVDTIRAISLTLEIRDPYTAGHQNRVAELCVEIAKVLGMNSSDIEGLRLGAMIHDIGKIYIPGEILNRPGKLTSPELEMIKSHVEIGYNIVKDIDFPWPIAQMVLQHHERLDGSGYPNGLKGEQISTNARIISVADAVEAMSSHRPYRPSRGITLALEEIETNRGIKYDERVVDICLDLFREKGFTFSDRQV